MTAETGTYRWMAPEVINHQPYDQKADISSFAIVLWELITAKKSCCTCSQPVSEDQAAANLSLRAAVQAFHREVKLQFYRSSKKRRERFDQAKSFQGSLSKKALSVAEALEGKGGVMMLCSRTKLQSTSSMTPSGMISTGNSFINS